MGLDALAAMGLQTMFNIAGVPITVTRPSPDDTPVTTTGMWIQRPLEEQRPFGKDMQQYGARKVLGIIRTDDLQTAPRGTVILAPETDDGVVKTWKVDGFESAVEPDLLRVILVATADT